MQSSMGVSEKKEEKDGRDLRDKQHDDESYQDHEHFGSFLSLSDKRGPLAIHANYGKKMTEDTA